MLKHRRTYQTLEEKPLIKPSINQQTKPPKKNFLTRALRAITATPLQELLIAWHHTTQQKTISKILLKISEKLQYLTLKKFRPKKASSIRLNGSQRLHMLLLIFSKHTHQEINTDRLAEVLKPLKPVELGEMIAEFPKFKLMGVLKEADQNGHTKLYQCLISKMPPAQPQSKEPSTGYSSTPITPAKAV